MEKQCSSIENSLPEEDSLTLPHFDDEATIQSARPVVPLREVKRAARAKRQLLLGATICFAAVAGALGASLIYDQLTQRAEKTTAINNADVPELSADFVSPSGEVSGSTVNPAEAIVPSSDVALTSDVESERQVTPTTSKTRQGAVKNSRVEKPVEKIARQAEVQNVPEPDIVSEQQLLREQRREARRARRERRANAELMRIREIFEGSPQP